MHGLALTASIANALPITVKLALATGIYIHLRLMIKRLKNRRHKIKQSEALGWEVSDPKHWAGKYPSAMTLNRFKS